MRARHQPERFVEVVLRAERNHVSRGDLANARCLRIKAAPDDAKRDVTVGDDSDQPRSLLDDRERTDVFLLHQSRRLTNRRFRRDGARPLRHHLNDLRSHDCPLPRSGCLISAFPPRPLLQTASGRRGDGCRAGHEIGDAPFCAFAHFFEGRRRM